RNLHYRRGDGCSGASGELLSDYSFSGGAEIHRLRAHGAPRCAQSVDLGWIVTHRVSCARERSPSLTRMWLTWFSAVRTQMYRRSAMSRFDSPSATSAAISRSRAESGEAAPGRGRLAGAAG